LKFETFEGRDAESVSSVVREHPKRRIGNFLRLSSRRRSVSTPLLGISTH